LSERRIKKVSKITFSKDLFAEKSNTTHRKMLDLEVIPERSLGCPEKSWEFILGKSISLFLCYTNNFLII